MAYCRSAFPLTSDSWVPLFTQAFLLPHERLVLTFACKLVQDKLLHQTASNMQAHSDSKVLEYMLSIAVRTWVVREGNRRGNQTATPRRVIRLRFSVVSLTDKCS